MKRLLTLLVAAMFSLATFAQTPAATHLKKDGTADKRYKENKAPAKPAGPKKKDGTPDMRYKANKPVAPVKPKKKS